jgi:hypothetical protein
VRGSGDGMQIVTPDIVTPYGIQRGGTFEWDYTPEQATAAELANLQAIGIEPGPGINAPLAATPGATVATPSVAGAGIPWGLVAVAVGAYFLLKGAK